MKWLFGGLIEEYFQKIYRLLNRIFRTKLVEDPGEYTSKDYVIMGIFQLLAAIIGIVAIASVLMLVAFIISLF